MYHFDKFYQQLQETRLHTWIDSLQCKIEAQLKNNPHGKLEAWENNFNALPTIMADHTHYNTPRVRAHVDTAMSHQAQQHFKQQLLQFSPWRKGPYELFGTHIDTEWRSDWKWERIKDYIAPLEDKLVLDIGCGNGYHMWRMLGEQAKLVVGVDPSQLFLIQFHIIKKYLGQQLPIHLIPLRGEDLPNFNNQGFDSVFSMGVLYHRKSPFNHLQELHQFLKPNGQLILETLVIEGDCNTVLVPQDRYAKMRNVWFIPSVEMLSLWLERVGFSNIQIADISPTSTKEQRSTEWMTFESLPEFLQPDNQTLSIEGYPAPLRACLTCYK
jgi:tRNA (mo5U34)-methyltransferase